MVQWTTGDNNDGVNGLGGTPAQVGINKGDGKEFSVFDGSYTNDITNIVNGSNVDIPGVYVIRISDGVIPTSRLKSYFLSVSVAVGYYFYYV